MLNIRSNLEGALVALHTFLNDCDCVVPIVYVHSQEVYVLGVPICFCSQYYMFGSVMYGTQTL